MTTNPSGVPWKYQIEDERIIRDANGRRVLEVVGIWCPKARKERAEFIVNAVNCHAELLEALKELSWQVVKNGCNVNAPIELINSVTIAQRVIDKAEGRA